MSAALSCEWSTYTLHYSSYRQTVILRQDKGNGFNDESIRFWYTCPLLWHASELVPTSFSSPSLLLSQTLRKDPCLPIRRKLSCLLVCLCGTTDNARGNIFHCIIGSQSLSFSQHHHESQYHTCWHRNSSFLLLLVHCLEGGRYWVALGDLWAKGLLSKGLLCLFQIRSQVAELPHRSRGYAWRVWIPPDHTWRPYYPIPIWPVLQTNLFR